MGIVLKPRDTLEMKGGNFMRVRVAMDVTKPLCRGRVITWDQGREGWVLFMYNRLPKICYWCGYLSHDDKECIVWLSSKGDLSGVEQQFGPWLRVSQFNTREKPDSRYKVSTAWELTGPHQALLKMVTRVRVQTRRWS